MIDHGALAVGEGRPKALYRPLHYEAVDRVLTHRNAACEIDEWRRAVFAVEHSCTLASLPIT
jgi:hypothetical protein